MLRTTSSNKKHVWLEFLPWRMSYFITLIYDLHHKLAAGGIQEVLALHFAQLSCLLSRVTVLAVPAMSNNKMSGGMLNMNALRTHTCI